MSLNPFDHIKAFLENSKTQMGAVALAGITYLSLPDGLLQSYRINISEELRGVIAMVTGVMCASLIISFGIFCVQKFQSWWQARTKNEIQQARALEMLTSPQMSKGELAILIFWKGVGKQRFIGNPHNDEIEMLEGKRLIKMLNRISEVHYTFEIVDAVWDAPLLTDESTMSEKELEAILRRLRDGTAPSPW